MTIENNTLLAAIGHCVAVELLPNHSPAIEHAGRYLLDSVMFHQGGQIELGLTDSNAQHLGYFELNRDIFLDVT